MSELLGVDVRTGSEQLQNIFKTNELVENSVIRKIRTTATDGKNILQILVTSDFIPTTTRKIDLEPF